MSGHLKKNEIKTLSKILEPGEEVISVARQHRIKKLIAPAIAIATDKRIIIMKRDALGIRSDIHFIPYEHIVSFRVVHGFLLTSIKLRLLGAPKQKEQAVTGIEEDETEIGGLTKTVARLLAGKLSERIQSRLENGDVIHQSATVINIFMTDKSMARRIPSFYLPTAFQVGSKDVMNDYINTTDIRFEKAGAEKGAKEKTAVENAGEIAYAAVKPQESIKQNNTLNLGSEENVPEIGVALLAAARKGKPKEESEQHTKHNQAGIGNQAQTTTPAQQNSKNEKQEATKMQQEQTAKKAAQQTTKPSETAWPKEPKEFLKVFKNHMQNMHSSIRKLFAGMQKDDDFLEMIEKKYLD